VATRSEVSIFIRAKDEASKIFKGVSDSIRATTKKAADGVSTAFDASWRHVLQTTGQAVRQLKRELTLAQADIKQAQADGLITPQEAKKRGAAAAKAFNAGILLEIKDLGATKVKGKGVLQTEQGQALAAALTGQLVKVDAATTKGVAGLGKLTSAFNALIFGLAGVPGPLGRVVSSLSFLTFGAGGIATAIIAGIAGIAAAFQFLTKESREAKARTDELVESLSKTAKEKTGTTDLENRALLLKRVTEATRRFRQAQSGIAIGEFGSEARIVDQGALKRRRKELEDAVRALGEANQAVVAGDKRRNDALRGERKERLQAEIDIIRTRVDGNKATAADIRRLSEIQTELNAELALSNNDLQAQRDLTVQLVGLEDLILKAKRAQREEELKLLTARQGTFALTPQGQLRLLAIERDIQAQLEKKNLSLAEEIRLREQLASVTAARQRTLLSDRLLSQFARGAEATRGNEITVKQPTVGGQAGRGEFPFFAQGESERAKRQARELNRAIKLMADRFQELDKAILEILDGALSDFFADILIGAENLSEAAQSFGRAVAQALAQLAARGIASEVVGVLGGALKGFAGGGVVRGPGGPTDDRILALLSSGEGVLTAKAVAALGGPDAVSFLNQLGSAGSRRRLPRFAEGGVAGDAQGVNINGRIDVGLSEGLVLQHLQTPAGERALIRIAQRNKNAFNSALGR